MKIEIALTSESARRTEYFLRRYFKSKAGLVKLAKAAVMTIAAWAAADEVSQSRRVPKQVVSGYHRPVCVKCCCEMRPETNGIGLLDMAQFGGYELWDADKWKCPECGVEVVGGFAHGCISAHYESDFQRMIAHYEDKGLLIKNKG